MSHSTILRSIQTITETLTKNSLNETKDIKNFIQWFLLKKNKFSIYLGAGASKTVKSWDSVENDYICNSKTWRDLLLEMYNRLGDDREKFLISASARVGELNSLRKRRGNNGKARTIQELGLTEWKEHFKYKNEEIVKEVLDKLGPFRFAWSLRWFFSENLDQSTLRNEALAKIVNKPIVPNPDEKKNILQSSPLLPTIVKLPFRDIITTNYDNYIEYFLDHEKQQREKLGQQFDYCKVYDVTSLVSSFQRYIPRLFYLHGKAGKSNLIFDKYDYAKLFSQDNQILNYLVGEFLRYGVLYIGFGLDDQTFDFMETQIKAVYEREGIGRDKIPVSYALIRNPEISKHEKAALKSLFNIRVIEYENYEDLPLVFEQIGLIIEYTEQLGLDTEWTDDPDQQNQLIKGLKKNGVKEYLAGRLLQSLIDHEKALGYTMFWECDSWDEIQQMCESRRKLALIRSKLKLTKQKNQLSNEKRGVKEIISSHVEQTENLINKYNPINKTLLKDASRERYVLDMLKARLAYHNSEFSDALKNFKATQHEMEKGSSSLINASKNKIRKGGSAESDINLLETYYFAQCQIDRAEAMLEFTPRSIDIFEVAKSARKIHGNLQKIKDAEEKDWRIKEFGNIVVISTWASAYGNLREFGRFVDTGNHAKRQKNIADLEEINKTLEDGWHYATAHDCLPSPRWVTVKHRSRCRALALIWFNNPELTDKLTDAYKSVQKAIEITTKYKDDLKIQHIRNLLEAVRLNTLTNFIAKTHVAKTINAACRTPKEMAGFRAVANSPMCYAASYHYLKSAFLDIEQLENVKNLDSYIDWLKIQAYEITSVWKLVFDDFLKDAENDVQSNLLHTFLKNRNDRQFVEKKYKKYGKEILGDEKNVKVRIDSFKKVFDKVEKAWVRKP